jgi:YbbR domain-containing protein
MMNSSPLRRSYKLLLFLIAGLIVLVTGGLLLYGGQDEATRSVPVRFQDLPPGLITVRNTPLVIEACLKGPSRVLKSIKDSQLYCEVDLSRAEPGPLFVNVYPEMIKVPSRVSVLETDPASFTITLDKKMDKVVPIVADLNQDPAPGYTVASVVATPCTIQLTGPMSVLEEISAVRTTPVDVGGLTETVKKKVALNLNHKPHVKAVGESLVEIEIVVEQKMAEEWLDIAVQATGSTYKYVITPDRIEILLRGPVHTLEKLTEGDGVEVCVDLKGLAPGTYVRPAGIKPPLNTTLVEAKPEVFTVKVLRSRQAGRS